MRCCLRISATGDDFTTTIWDMLCQVSCVYLFIAHKPKSGTQCEGSQKIRATEIKLKGTGTSIGSRQS